MINFWFFQIITSIVIIFTLYCVDGSFPIKRIKLIYLVPFFGLVKLLYDYLENN